MKTKLSHSATDKHTLCGELYRLHYIERLRPSELRSPLIFGGALDEALNALLTKTGDPETIFVNKLTYTKDLFGNEVYIPTCEDIKYQKNDYDQELIIDEVPENLSPKATENFLAWSSLKAKGLLMLRDYRTKVLPEIEEVVSVQENISLDNQDGDSFIGVVDLVAKVRNWGPVILDNKTTSRPYKKDSVKESKQLATYVHALESKYSTRAAGYITMSKNVRKNRTKTCSLCGHDGTGKQHKSCDNRVTGSAGKLIRCGGDWDMTIAPEIDFQIIIDYVPEDFEAAIIEAIDNTNSKIKAGVFEKNFDACHNMFGQRCPYFNLCHSGSDEGLVNLNKIKLDK